MDFLITKLCMKPYHQSKDQNILLLNGGEVGVLFNYHFTLCDQYLAENLSGLGSEALCLA